TAILVLTHNPVRRRDQPIAAVTIGHSLRVARYNSRRPAGPQTRQLVHHYYCGNKTAEYQCIICFMEIIDVRRLSKDAQQLLRRQVIAARKDGQTYQAIRDSYGVQIGTACAWWKRYQTEGEAFIERDQRGRPKGSGTRLTAQQSQRIQRLIQDRMPDQLKLPFALWTRHAVQRLIESQYGVLLPIRTVGEYL